MTDQTVLESAGCKALKLLGIVYLVVESNFGITAAKVISLQHFNEREWEVAGKISKQANICQYVINYKGAQIIQDHAIILMEYANLPPLQKIFDQNFPILPREDFVKSIMWQLLNGISVIHEAGLIHRDLIADNIMFHNIYGSDQVIVKITDFGLAREKDPQGRGVTQCGTPLGMAPEVMMDKSHFIVGNQFNQYQQKQQQLIQYGYNEKVDIWSLGILFFKLLTKRYPFEANNIMQLINIIQRPIQRMPSNRSLECIDLLKKMLQFQPQQRISAEDALSHDWFKQDGNGQLYQINPTRSNCSSNSFASF
ncbi:MAG: putative serine/threonine-protein kinase ATG1c [Streblomastix strix]|uniref:Putative serine/threonine-protein kinase ATG1c n=1 Tax=Streblomastix strix TaxID=222440 RepID=A0A5J4WHR5_9EUKA|nr:MAG: putative serine/threonine-protein kinase ATG1c [Streblomastix strix]